MVAINFPDSPVDGQTHVAGNRTWIYNSTTTKWGAVLSGLGTLDSSDVINILASNINTFDSADIINILGRSTLYLDSANDRVGIGTLSPSSKLDVNGTITATGYSGTIDGTNLIGFRNIPPVGTKTSSYTLATADVGKYVQVGTSGSITIPDATFSEGDVVSIFNNTSGNITITCSITTAYIAGTDTDKSSVTLATRGVANVFFISGTVCVITGNVT